MRREIFRLAIPNILSNLSVPLLGLVDVALMGHLDRAELFLGAMALATAIFNVLYWSFGFLRMGTTGLTAQAYGREDQEESALVLGRGMLVALAVAALMLLFQGPLLWAGLEVMEGSAEAKGIASDYFNIRIWAAPAALGMMVFNGWFLGMQNAIFPLVLSLVINLVNIGANFILVVVYGMEAEGIAWGTVIAQYTGLGGAILLFWFRYRGMIYRKLWSRIWETGPLKHFFLVNRDIFIRTALLVFVFTFFTAQSGAFGDEVLAANSLLLQLLHLMSYLVDGVAFAAEGLVGKYLGRGDPELLRRLIRQVVFWGMLMGLAFTLLYVLAGPWILGLLSNEEMVVQKAGEYLPWAILMPIWGAFSYLWDGIYIGATGTKALRNVMAIAVLLVFLPTYYLSNQLLDNHGLWLAMTLFMICRGVGLAILAPRLWRPS